MLILSIYLKKTFFILIFIIFQISIIIYILNKTYVLEENLLS